ncbi:hypothetical protein COU23_00355 [Candidatus Kuenenbacteria bacterium CG10_big_fil_rev_8_21_14_0_10_36_11]|uniref:RNA polymerase subunit sigma-24 n=1 Tax=Candidatus Kuenenbacteria bacterium CG10_big_fil_rev_8_21_14_0_10_36_11 TaxID=1974618 RepID=A0A2M6WBE8_9BACT|nr:MAG: hypothetical protein COU23_00355 [Candidatus Kuenenbacteria bacterium CG10_big_fil_rev_8_21_14_0_10_36_11]
MIETNDSQLVQKYLSGDEESLKLLIRNYLKPVFSFVYHFFNNHAEAEDIAQDVFVKMWKNLKKFDQQKKFKTWLFAIAKNTALDYLKKKKFLLFSEFINADGENILEETLTDINPLPDEIFEQADLAQTLEKIFDKLPAHYRVVLDLYYQKSFNLREIAEILGKQKNTIKSWHRRALIKLKEKLSNAPQNNF